MNEHQIAFRLLALTRFYHLTVLCVHEMDRVTIIAMILLLIVSLHLL